jgi:hypothetical protein
MWTALTWLAIIVAYLLGRGTFYRWAVSARKRWHYRMTQKRAEAMAAAHEIEHQQAIIRAQAEALRATWPYETVVAFAAFLVAHPDANITSNEEWMAERVEEFCAREGWSPRG